MTFTYRIMESSGAISEGLIEAQSRKDALHNLESKGQLLKLQAQKAGAFSLTALLRPDGSRQRRIRNQELSNFTRQLSALLTAGVPLATAMQYLIDEASSPSAQAQWQAIADPVIEGAALADAMGKFPKTFPRVYVAMVRAGEMGGFLDLVLGQIADFQERDRELRGKMLSAITYPLILITLSIGVLGFLMVYFIPKFQAIFSDFGASLPTLTSIIVTVSYAIRSYGLIALPALIILGIFLQRQLQTSAGRHKLDHWLLQTPILKDMTSAFAMTRFSRMLGTLVGAGVPLLNALHVARESLGNQILIEAVEGAVRNVQRGGTLAHSLADCPDLFPKSALQIIAIAEQTGELDHELTRLADSTERTLDARLRFATSLAEPLLLFAMAAIIGVIVVGMVLPIFALQDYIK